MRLRRYLAITVIAALGSILFSSVNPAFSYSSSRNSQPMGQLQQPNQSGLLIAARGCDGANSARDSLQSAVDELKKVNEESRVLDNALDYSVQGLRAVNRYIDQACR